MDEVRDSEAPVNQAEVDDLAIQELQTLMGGQKIDQGSANYMDVDEIYSAISESVRNLDFDDEPTTWEAAKESGDAERWKQGYQCPCRHKNPKRSTNFHHKME